MPTRILVADDERSMLTVLGRALRLESYEVDFARDGEEALTRMRMGTVDALVLDVSMPRLDGLEVCRRLRADGDATPVLMLTARDAIEDRVVGLDAGADDYLTKPFAIRELMARVRALLRRVGADDAQDALEFADLVLDLRAFEGRRGTRTFSLSKTEVLLLELFLRHPRQILTRSTIFEAVWGYDFGPSSNSLGVYIGYLRRKLEAGGEARLLHTVRGSGYILRL